MGIVTLPFNGNCRTVTVNRDILSINVVIKIYFLINYLVFKIIYSLSISQKIKTLLILNEKPFIKKLNND